MKQTNLSGSLFAALLAVLFAGKTFATPHESGSKKAPFAVEIQYISIGAGIDSDLKQKIESLMAPKMLLQKIDYIKISGWGREGESTVCVQFRSYKDTFETYQQVEDLIQQTSSRFTKVELRGDCNRLIISKINE